MLLSGMSYSGTKRHLIELVAWEADWMKYTKIIYKSYSTIFD